MDTSYSYTYNLEPDTFAPTSDVVTGGTAVGAAFGAMMGIIMVVSIIVLIAQIVVIVGKWRVLSKMGRKPWAAIIPYFSDFEMTAGASGNAALSLAIPIVGLATAIFTWLSGDVDSVAINGISGLLGLAYFVLTCVMCHKVAQAFDKSAGWTVGLILLGVVFWPMLGFGQSAYQGFVDVEDGLIE